MSHGYHKTHNRSVINLYDLLLNCTCVGTLKIKHYTFWYATAQHLQFLIIAFHYYYFESTVFSSFFFRQCSEMCRHFVFAVITCYSCWRWILGWKNTCVFLKRLSLMTACDFSWHGWCRFLCEKAERIQKAYRYLRGKKQVQ